MLNENVFSNQWKALRPQIKERWHALNDDDLKLIDGNRTMLVSVLQEKYACTADQAETQIDQFLNQVSVRT